VAELKSGVHLVLSKNLKTVAVFIPKDNLVPVDGTLLKEFARANGYEFDWRRTPKDELIRMITSS
jgi:hypothetical protein